jgi:hypothetical protein
MFSPLWNIEIPSQDKFPGSPWDIQSWVPLFLFSMSLPKPTSRSHFSQRTTSNSKSLILDFVKYLFQPLTLLSYLLHPFQSILVKFEEKAKSQGGFPLRPLNLA